MPDKYRGRCFQPTIELSTGSLLEELEKGLKELRGFAAPLGGREATVSTGQIKPELLGTGPPTKEYT